MFVHFCICLLRSSSSLSFSLIHFLKFKYLKLPERQKKVILFKNSFAAAKWNEVKSSLSLVLFRVA